MALWNFYPSARLAGQAPAERWPTWSLSTRKQCSGVPQMASPILWR